MSKSINFTLVLGIANCFGVDAKALTTSAKHFIKNIHITVTDSISNSEKNISNDIFRALAKQGGINTIISAIAHSGPSCREGVSNVDVQINKNEASVKVIIPVNSTGWKWYFDTNYLFKHYHYYLKKYNFHNLDMVGVNLKYLVDQFPDSDLKFYIVKKSNMESSLVEISKKTISKKLDIIYITMKYLEPKYKIN